MQTQRDKIKLITNSNQIFPCVFQYEISICEREMYSWEARENLLVRRGLVIIVMSLRLFPKKKKYHAFCGGRRAAMELLAGKRASGAQHALNGCAPSLSWLVHRLWPDPSHHTLKNSHRISRLPSSSGREPVRASVKTGSILEFTQSTQLCKAF
jgi:hypothetical protein